MGTPRTPLPVFDDPVQTAWLAGLLEGEGCFSVWRFRHQSGTVSLYPRIQLGMCDVDVVRRVTALWNTSLPRASKPGKEHWKPFWRCSCSGPRAAIVMEAVLPYMGERRAARIREVLEETTNRKAVAA